jgi:farnesyl diphosphate synthase
MFVCTKVLKTRAVLSMLSSTPTMQSASMSKLATEKKEFSEFFNVLVKDVKDDIAQYRLPPQGVKWIEEMLPYTTVGGKMNRGLTVLSALKSILKGNVSHTQKTQAQVLGWSVELLQAFFLVADDMMDSSITRRGQPCWYRKSDVGMVAINDSFILESIIYRLIKKYFRSESYYVDVLDLFHEVTFQTELGQLMDLITAPEGDVDLSRFSIEK